MRKLLTFALLTLLGLVIGAGGAFAAWKLSASAATSSAQAVSMPAMAAPSAAASNSTATVTFPAANLATGYEVKRYNNLNVATILSGCTGTISITCTDANLANGTYNYSVAALRGNWKGLESNKKAVTVNASPPVINLTHPTNGGVYNSTTWDNACTQKICGTTSSATGVANVKVSVRQGTGSYYSAGFGFSSATEVLNIVEGTTNWYLNFSRTAFPADGSYTVRVVATDTAGNASSTSSTFVIDRSGPSTGQFGFGYVKNGTTLSIGYAVDNGGTGISGVSYYFCGTDSTCTSRTLIGTSTTPTTYPLTWNSQPADGTYWVQAAASDFAGNTTTSKATISVDNTGPTTTDNTTGNWTNTSQLVTFTRNDGTGVAGGTTYYTTNGTTPTTASSSGNSVTISGAGIHTIKYFSVDALGNAEAVKTASHPIRIDTTIPNQPTITAPANNSWIKNGVTLTATASDNASGTSSGIASVTWLCSGGTCGGSGTAIGTSTTAPYSVVWNSQPVNDDYTITARATDAAGNSNSTSFVVNIDNTMPTVTLDEPDTNDILDGDFDLSATASDLHSGIANVTFQYSVTGANTWTTIGSDSNASQGYDFNNWDTQAVTDGIYDVRALATDRAGNQTAAVSTIVIDNDFTATSVQLLNGVGANVSGKVERGDSIVVTYSDAIRVNSMCDDWPTNGNGNNQSLTNASVNLADGGGSQDTITITVSTCSFNFGRLDLGSTGYITNGTAVFSNSQVSWNVASKTLTITLGTKGASGTIPTTAVATSIVGYVRDTDLRNIYGIAPTANFTTPTGQKF